MSSPEHAEWEHFEERNSKFHNGILLLTQAYHILTYIDLFRPIWAYMDPFEPLWTYMDLNVPIWTLMDLFGPEWKYLDLKGNIWTLMEIFGPFRPIRTHKDL